MRQLWKVGLLLLLFSLSLSATAQNPPIQLNEALLDLSGRVGQTVTINDISFTFEQQQFGNTSLGCPQPGLVYPDVVTVGYRFDIDYAGQQYDYRVSEDTTIVILCENDGNICPDIIVVEPGDNLFRIATRCGFTVQILIAANPDLEDPSNILVGQSINIPNDGLPPPSIQNPVISVFPVSAGPSTLIDVIANGFPVNSTVNIGVGLLNRDYDIYLTLSTDEFGALRTQVVMPDDVAVGEQWVIRAVTENFEFQANAFPITITEDGNVGGFDTVNIFLISLSDDGALGPLVGCGDSVVPFTVSIEPTVAPLTAALESLLSIRQRDYAGFYNSLGNANLQLAGVNIQNGLATINLTGELNLAGVCDDPRVVAQIEQTALQYSTVNDVDIFLNGQPLQ